MYVWSMYTIPTRECRLYNYVYCSPVCRCSKPCPLLRRQWTAAVSTSMPVRVNWSLSFTADMVSEVYMIHYSQWSASACMSWNVGIVKTHNLGFQECEALQAVFTKDMCPNQIIGPAKWVSVHRTCEHIHTHTHAYTHVHTYKRIHTCSVLLWCSCVNSLPVTNLHVRVV